MVAQATPRGRLVASAMALIAIVITLTLWVFPEYFPAQSGCPLNATFSGRPYCAESVQLGECLSTYGCLYPAPGFVFHDVEFQLTLHGSKGLAELNGNVTESNSTSYRFYLAGDVLGQPSVNWTSPDHEVLVEMHSPYATVASNGELVANVTCGVTTDG